VLAVREFPGLRGRGSSDRAAVQRSGAAGGWPAGAIYDYAGFAAAFATGIVLNLANLLVVGLLVFFSRLRS
jgi:hypothetical protein